MRLYVRFFVLKHSDIAVDCVYAFSLQPLCFEHYSNVSQRSTQVKVWLKATSMNEQARNLQFMQQKHKWNSIQIYTPPFCIYSVRLKVEYGNMALYFCCCCCFCYVYLLYCDGIMYALLPNHTHEKKLKESDDWTGKYHFYSVCGR